MAYLIDRSGRRIPPMAGGAPERTLEDIEARMTEVRTRLTEINTAHAGQSYPDDVKDEWNALNTEYDELERTQREVKARDERVRQLLHEPTAREEEGAGFNVRVGKPRGEAIFDLSTIQFSMSDGESGIRELDDRARRAVEEMVPAHERANTEDARARLTRLLNDDRKSGALARHIMVTGSRAYASAFTKQMAGKPLTAEETRALSHTGTAGGFAVPLTLDPTLIPTSNLSVNPFRGIARQVTLVGSETWTGVSQAGITASRVAENAAITPTQPTLAQPKATVTSVKVEIPFSIELDQDWASLQSEMATVIQDAKDDEEATSFTTGAGDGITGPQGLITGATTTVNAGTTLVFAVADVYALENALPPRFRQRAVWVANRAIYNRIRQFDTGGGGSLWTQLPAGLQNQVPSPGALGLPLLGYPAYEDSAMTTAITAAAKYLVIGDFRYMIIVDRVGMLMELVPHRVDTSGALLAQRSVFAMWRNSSIVVSPNAFRVLVGI